MWNLFLKSGLIIETRVLSRRRDHPFSARLHSLRSVVCRNIPSFVPEGAPPMSGSRRFSTSSVASDNSSHLATSPLILADRADDTPSSPFNFSSDDEDDEQLFNPPPAGVQQASWPTLSTPTVFLYLLAPYLKLGAMLLLSNDRHPLKYSVPLVVFFATLSGFSRHILYLLSRHLRKADLGENFLFLYAFLSHH